MINDSSRLKKFFLSLGYTEEASIKIIEEYHIKNHNEDTLIEKVKDIYDYLITVYKKEDTIKITTKNPNIYSFSSDKIHKKLVDISLLGYTEDEVIKITKTFQKTIWCI